MRIADMTNLCDNGTFEQDAPGTRPSDWSSGRVVNNPLRVAMNPSARCLEIPARMGNSHGTLTRLIAVNPGDQLQIELLYRFANNLGTGSLRVGFMLHNPARGYMGWYHRPPVGSTVHPPARTTAWTRGEWHLTVPAGVGFIRLDFYFSGNGETTNLLFLDNIVARRRLGGQLIVEGSIRADHIQAGAIEARHIRAGAIRADMIRAGSMSADLIAGGMITSSVFRATLNPFSLDIRANRMMPAQAGWSGGYTPALWLTRGEHNASVSIGVINNHATLRLRGNAMVDRILYVRHHNRNYNASHTIHRLRNLANIHGQVVIPRSMHGDGRVASWTTITF